MKEITSSKDLIKEWNITVADFEGGDWGNIMGKFKIYRSLLLAWTKTEVVYDMKGIEATRFLGVVTKLDDVLAPQDGDVVVETTNNEMYKFTTSGWTFMGAAESVKDGNGKPITRQKVDTEKLIKEITILYIKGIYGMYPQLREIGYSHLQYKTQNFLKEAVLLATQHALTNRNVLEKVTSVLKKGTSVEVTAEPNQSIIPVDLYGIHAATSITMSEIDHYEVVGVDGAKIMTENGNTVFIGKFDPRFVKDMD